MNNYIVIDGVTYDLVRREGTAGKNGVRLSDIPVSGACKIGSHEMIVLEQGDGVTLLLRKDILCKSRFGDTNNYDGSDADGRCKAFADEIADLVGGENMVEFTVDLTANDGLKCYGSIQRKAALLTANQCRQYVDILDEHKLDKWWWTATAYSTPKHGDKDWGKCVSPGGRIGVYDVDFCYGDFGVRPFCILKSHIFVSQ